MLLCLREKAGSKRNTKRVVIRFCKKFTFTRFVLKGGIKLRRKKEKCHLAREGSVKDICLRQPLFSASEMCTAIDTELKMLTRRNWLLRFSIILNVVVLCYVATHFVSYNNGVEIVEDLQGTGRNLAVIEYNADVNGVNSHQESRSGKLVYLQAKRDDQSREKIQEGQGQNSQDKDAINDYPTNNLSNKTSDFLVSAEETAQKTGEIESVVMSIPLKTSPPKILVPSTTQFALNASTASAEITASSRYTSQASEKKLLLQEVIKCHDRDQIHKTAQRGDFWVLYNYIRSSRTFKCYETVTYTTHADFTFLDNLEPLLERWQGPVSVALHAPGTDFNATVNTIQYLRECGSNLVAELVTFHIYFGSKYVPKKILKPEEVVSLKVNCSFPPPWVNVTSKQLFKTQKKILYPVNVGRNIARESAVTFYILPSDIELYPSPGVIKNFLELVRRQDPPLRRENPKVFPLPIFELEANASVPANKTQLVHMLKTGKAIPFHKKVCPGCHNIPRSKEWILANETQGLHVFHIGKRTNNFRHWEPIFIGTHEDPLYDERLSWEGKSDKMTQGYALCVLDYEFHILDNAFLVHKPGIKTVKKDTARAILASKTNSHIQRVILPELRVLYGVRKGCYV